MTLFTDEMDCPLSIPEIHCALNGPKDSTPVEDRVPYSFLTKPKSRLDWIVESRKVIGATQFCFRKDLILPIALAL